jgi:beta,beta-carotene 9',10'-dioxygenase
MEPYIYVYGLGAVQPYKFPHQLIKVNIKTGASQTWSQNGCYANKPTFVPNPTGKNEDEGVVLSVVFDSIRKKSFLLILDAKKFTELAKAELPCAIPLGLVGTFSSDIVKK